MLNYEPKLIKSQEDYEIALFSLDELMDKDELSESERNRLELLAHLIEEYENVKFPYSSPDPVEAIKFRMEQAGLKQKDLIPFIGDKSQVSLVINNKKPLTLSMIRALHVGLEIPLDSLILKEQKRLVPEVKGVDWNLFPITKMYNHNKDVYFPGINASLKAIKDDIERYIKDLFEPYKDIVFANNLFRRNSRLSEKYDKYALIAWLSAICRLADQTEHNYEFEIGKKELILSQLRMISTFDEGPKLAKEFLNKVGIRLIILKHLPKTFLDGVSLNIRENEPIIGLTLRYDRIDYFWFTLFHELGHVFKHLSNDGKTPILDNLDIKANSEIETEADNFAADYLIPNDEVEEAGLINVHITEDKITQFAHHKQIHPAIVAGRIRNQLKNYYILKGLVGYSEVRKQFDY